MKTFSISFGPSDICRWYVTARIICLGAYGYLHINYILSYHGRYDTSQKYLSLEHFAPVFFIFTLSFLIICECRHTISNLYFGSRSHGHAIPGYMHTILIVSYQSNACACVSIDNIFEVSTRFAAMFFARSLGMIAFLYEPVLFFCLYNETPRLDLRFW